MKPNLLRGLFAHDINQWLEREGLGVRSAPDRYPLLNPAMISRAKNEHVLSAESFLALCDAARLDPLAYLDREQNQTVTAFAPRETSHPWGRS